jgi:hypothetical protein
MALIGGLGNPPTLGGGSGGAATDLTLGSDARGMIVRREAATWEGHQAKAAGQILVGDGTDIVSVAVSGDATLAASGALTIASPQRLYATTISLSATGAGADGAIVGSGVGALNDAAGVTIVPAVPGKRIMLLEMMCDYTRVTASYTGGGGLYAAYYTTFVTLVSTPINTGDSFASGTSSSAWVTAINNNANTVGGLSAFINKPLVIWSSAAVTQPGTAAGTANVTVYYHLVDK